MVRYFVAQAAAGGIDVFRVFDCLNWVENMKVTIEAVLATGPAVRGRHLLHRQSHQSARDQVQPRVLLKIGRELKAMGTHVLRIKDMAGLCQPRAAATLVKALKEEIGLPIHFHTHDTSGIASGERPRRDRGGGGCRRRRNRCALGPHVPAESGIDRRGAAPSVRATRAGSGQSAG